MPDADVAYAACSKPTQNAHPGVQPEMGLNPVKVYSALFLPCFAMAREQMRIAMTPQNVQKIANVYIA